jgi:hypothetical protein
LGLREGDLAAYYRALSALSYFIHGVEELGLRICTAKDPVVCPCSDLLLMSQLGHILPINPAITLHTTANLALQMLDYSLPSQKSFAYPQTSHNSAA